MANIKSAKKRAKQTIVRTMRNATKLNKMRTFIRKLEALISSNKKEEALEAFKKTESIIAKTAQNGPLHRNAAAKKISSLSAKIKKLA